MAQKTTGVYRLTQVPRFYELFQKLLGADRSRRTLIAEHVLPRPGDRVLDIGCGPAAILPYLGDVNYTGIDLNADHIAQAKLSFGGRGRFIHGDTSHAAAMDGLFDIVLCLGLLHHLDDEAVVTLATDVRSKLASGGRFFAVDPVFAPGQPWIARRLAANDSGQNVREADGYRRLVAGAFPHVRTEVRHNLLRVPYSHCITTASAAST